MIVESLVGLLAVAILVSIVLTVWLCTYRKNYKTLYKALEEARFAQVEAERQLEVEVELSHHRKVTLDNVVGIVMADKNQVPKAIKMMVVTETHK